MRKTGIILDSVTFAGILFCICAICSCKRTNYTLLDQSSAGVWTTYDTADGLPGNKVSDIKLDKEGNLWMAFPGFGTAEYSNGSWISYKTSNSSILSNAVTCLGQETDGSIVIGTSDGLSILSASNAWSSYIDASVTSMTVTAIKIASDGSVWVGTRDQGFYVNKGSGYVRTYSTTYKTINAIEEDASGNIWMGSDNGLIKWDGSSYSYLTTADGLPADTITALHEDGKLRLWIGTNGGKDAAWIDKTGLHHLSLLDGQDSVTITSIFDDRSGNIWFATSSIGLIKYNGIIPYSYTASENTIPENSVLSIGEDKDGNLWFGLFSKGAVKYTLPIN
ncbi:MAG: two-component regulator propeller domain-containing protein [Bacteroidales bacterium]|jgi:ligand-binding sensor domain-containing protein